MEKKKENTKGGMKERKYNAVEESRGGRVGE